MIFSALQVDGTFPLTEAHVNASKGAPDVIVSLRWNSEKNDYGAPGMIVAMEGRRNTGTHASLSRFDLHNTLVCAGPDFKSGFVNRLPSGNIDVAPTVLSILGLEPPRKMDGRVLFEAMTQPDAPDLKPREEKREAASTHGFLTWNQYLKKTYVGYTSYFEEGNGEPSLR